MTARELANRTHVSERGGCMKKPVGIEELLHWAYRDELPKGYEGTGEGVRPAISPMFRYADLGKRVDEWVTEPGFPAAMGQPHPDALLIDAAVVRLPEVGLDWAQSRHRLMPDLLAWADADDSIMSLLSFQPAALVELHSKMGTRPRWDLGPTRVERVINPDNGKPVVQYLDETGDVVCGRTAGRHYGPLARCPLKLDPPAREIARARAEYSVWHQAIDRVRETLRAWTLHEHEVLPTRAAPEPWILNTEPKRRILRNNRALELFA